MSKVTLTPYESQVAVLVSLGFRNHEIAQALGRSRASVTQAIRSIAFKLRLDPTKSYRVQIARVLWELSLRDRGT